MKNSQGFSLIEVLVTLVLTTVGVLGMVAMQTKAIQYTNDSVTHTKAVLAVDDLIEILRSNRDKIYNSKNGIQEDSKYFKAAGEAFSDLTCDTYSGFAGANTPEKQLCVWVKFAQASLPGVTNEVLKNNFTIVPTVDEDDTVNEVEISIAWAVKVGECPGALEAELCSYTVAVEI